MRLSITCIILGLALAGVGAYLLLPPADESGGTGPEDGGGRGVGGPDRARGAPPAPIVPRDHHPSRDVVLRPGGDRSPDRAGTPPGLMVIDPDGRPIPGARVALGHLLSPRYEDYEQVRVADAQGLVPLTRENVTHTMWFCRHGAGEGWRDFKDLRGQTHVNLVLRRPAPVVIEVVDGAGRPKVDVPVLLAADEAERIARHASRAFEEHGVLRTDANGEARFVIPGGDPYLGRATRWRAAIREVVHAGPPRDPVLAEYDPEGEVRLRITDTTGHRLEIVAVDGNGARRPVSLRVGYWVKYEEDVRRTVLLSRGIARVRLPARPRRVRAWLHEPTRPPLAPSMWGRSGPIHHPEQYQDWRSSVSERIAALAWHDVPPGGGSTTVVPVDVSALPPVASVRVLDPDGDPMKDVPFHLVEEGHRRGRRTAAPGRLHFLADREQRVIVTPRHGHRKTCAPASLVVPGGRDVELPDLRLSRPPVLVAGRVTDHEGVGVAGARLVIGGAASEGAIRPGRDGVFEVRRTFPPGAGLRLVAHANDGRRSDVVEVPAGSRDVLVKLAATGKIAGRVRLAEPSPRMRIRVRHRAEGDVETGWTRFRHPTPLGRFVLEDVPAGTCDLTFETDGGIQRVVESVTVGAGQTTRDPRLLQVDLRDRDARIDVVVTDADGLPVEGAFVYYVVRPSKGKAFTHEAETDAAGLAAVAAAKAEDTLLVVEGEDGQYATVGRPAGRVPVRLPERTTFTFRVGGARGWLRLRPVPGAVPEALRQAIPSKDVRITGGASREVRLSPGRYLVLLTGPPPKDHGLLTLDASRPVVDLAR